jgi:hypothetical protein
MRSASLMVKLDVLRHQHFVLDIGITAPMLKGKT